MEGPPLRETILQRGSARFPMGAAYVEAFPQWILVRMPVRANTRRVRNESFPPPGIGFV